MENNDIERMNMEIKLWKEKMQEELKKNEEKELELKKLQNENEELKKAMPMETDEEIIKKTNETFRKELENAKPKNRTK